MFYYNPILITSGTVFGGQVRLSKEYEDWSRSSCQPVTHACNISKLKKVCSHLKALTPCEITVDDVKAYIQKRKDEGAKAGTINKEHIILRKLLDCIGGENPARKVPILVVDDETIPRPLYPDEASRFLSTLYGFRKYLYGYMIPVTMTYLYAGLRPTEIVALTPADINLEAGRIYVQAKGKKNYRTKTGTSRSVIIHPDLAPLIAKCVEEGGAYLFGKGRQLVANSVGRMIRKLIKAAKIDGITPYSLRHSFVSYMLRAGATLREVMEQAGHKRITTTMRYLHVIPDIDSPVKKIDFIK